MDDYRAAIIGLTGIAAVCDLQTDLIERFRQNWGAVFPRVHGYADYREMLACERIDLLSVVTPDHRHAQIVIDAVEAGVRAIFTGAGPGWGGWSSYLS